jgi:hypothetical protein
MSDDYICKDLNDNLFQGIMALCEAMEEEIEVVTREILVVVSMLS